MRIELTRIDENRNLFLKGHTMSTKTKVQMLSEIEELEIANELLANQRIHDALEADEINDEAKMAKDYIATLNKKRQTDGAREQSRFLMVASFGSDAEKRRYVESTQPEVRRLLGDGKPQGS
jgi:hypothetical protein